MQIFRLIKNKSNQFLHSIAMIPVVIVIIFLITSVAMIYFDYSETGKQLKSEYDWIRLKDPSTARTIVSVIAAGLISLTVFSFSMVMVVLNQAASQLSNRIIDKLIGNRLQQFVLGFYIGTIIYSLLLLTSIRDIESGIYVPALSSYFLILLSIVAIFLFVFFLHFITQSIKYSVIIKRIYSETFKSIQNSCRLSSEPEIVEKEDGQPVPAFRSGIFESFDSSKLVTLLKKKECTISLLHPTGQFVLQGTPLYLITYHNKISEEFSGEINELIMIVNEESVNNNFYYGLRQLTEVAIKALSPGINDPGTALESVRSLVKLLAYRLHHYPDNTVKDEKGFVRIITNEKTFEEIIENTLLPVWDYGNRDRMVQKEFKHLLVQLQILKDTNAVRKLLIKVDHQINKPEPD